MTAPKNWYSYEAPEGRFFDLFGPRDTLRLSTVQRSGLDVNKLVANGYVAHFMDIGPDYCLTLKKELCVERF